MTDDFGILGKTKVVNGQHSAIQLLISHEAKVSEPDINGKTALHLAAACGHLSCLQILLDHMDPLDAISVDNHNCTALHWACHSGSSNCVSFLLEKDIFKSLEGNVFSPVHCATFVGAERSIELLCKHYGNEIVKLKDARNRTPLHIAALHGHVDCAKYLLEQGGEINYKDLDGRTPLIAAAQNGQSQIIDLILNYKADMTLYDNNGNTALHLACLKRHSHSALLLLENIEDDTVVNMINNDRKTPLHLSARNGLVNVTRQLISKGSSVLALDINGMTPALCCAPNNNVAQCLALILANYALCSQQSDNKDGSLSSSYQDYFVKKLRKPKIKTSECRECQTEISLVENPDYFECKRLFNFHKPFSKARSSINPKTEFSLPKTTIPLNKKNLKEFLDTDSQNEVKEFMKRGPKESSCFLIEQDTPKVIESVPQTFGGRNLHHSYSDMFLAYKNRLDGEMFRKLFLDLQLKKNIKQTKQDIEKQKFKNFSQSFYKDIRKIAKELIDSYNPNINQNELLKILLTAACKADELQTKCKKDHKKNVVIKIFENELRTLFTQFLLNSKQNTNSNLLSNDPLEAPENQNLKQMFNETMHKIQEHTLLQDECACSLQSNLSIKEKEMISEDSLRLNRMQKITKQLSKQNSIKKNINVSTLSQKSSINIKMHMKHSQVSEKNSSSPESRDIKELFIKQEPSDTTQSENKSKNIQANIENKPKIIETSSDDAIVKVDQVMQQEQLFELRTIEQMQHYHRTCKATRPAMWNEDIYPQFNEANKKLIVEGLELIKSCKNLTPISEYLKMFDSTLEHWPNYFSQSYKIMGHIITIIKDHDWLHKLKNDLTTLDNQDVNFPNLTKNIDKDNDKNIGKLAETSVSNSTQTDVPNLINENVGIYDNVSEKFDLQEEIYEPECIINTDIISGVISMVPHTFVAEEMKMVLEHVEDVIENISVITEDLSSDDGSDTKTIRDENGDNSDDDLDLEGINDLSLDEPAFDQCGVKEILKGEVAEKQQLPKLPKKNSLTNIAMKKLLLKPKYSSACTIS